MKWQLIETAPKDGTEIIGWNGLEVTSFMWLNHADDEGHIGWACSGYEFGGILYSLHYVPSHPPTHWMPLPEPPEV